MRITVVLLALLIVASLSSCKDKKKKELTIQKVEVVEVVKPEPVAPPEPEPEPEKQVNYYLVAGCFDIESNAKSLNSKLLSEGFDSNIIPFYNMNMVTYGGFETRQEAQNALNQIVLDPEKEWTWVYPVK